MKNRTKCQNHFCRWSVMGHHPYSFIVFFGDFKDKEYFAQLSTAESHEGINHNTNNGGHLTFKYSLTFIIVVMLQLSILEIST